MAETFFPRQKPDFRLEELDGELLLYHPSQTVIMYCNQSASIIWQLCDGQRSVKEIIVLLKTAYEQDIKTMTGEVKDTLQLLCRHGAIEYVNQEGQVVAPPGSG